MKYREKKRMDAGGDGIKKILFVGNVAKEHILKFHVPTIRIFKENGWTVDVACSGYDKVPLCDHQFHTCWRRSPFSFKTFQGIRELKKIVHNGNYDIVYCHTPVGGLIARLAAKKTRMNGTKVIYFAHGFHFYHGAPKVNWLIYYPIEKYLTKYTDKIITNNNEDYTNANSKFKHVMHIYKVPGVGVDFDRLNIDVKDQIREQYRNHLNIPKNALVLVYVAELNKNKNQEMLLRTLHEIRKIEKDTYLLLIGPDHQNGYYQEMAAKMKIDGAVRFLGWRYDIGELLNASDICVASSIREGFGLNLVESMYCGLPVVASINRGHSTIIENGENGFLVPINDYHAMAEKVLEIWHNSMLRSKFSQIDVSRYNTARIAEKLYNIITE